ncbi:MAG: PAS domain S-box protein [Anaerolineae bacterium]|nr:PAS domain S-box protein [Anaerolineae bacterium]
MSKQELIAELEATHARLARYEQAGGDINFEQVKKYGNDLARIYIVERQKHDELKTTLRQLDTVIASIPHGLLVVDDSLTVQKANSAFCELFQKDSETVIGKTLNELNLPEGIEKALLELTSPGSARKVIEIQIDEPEFLALRTWATRLNSATSGGWLILVYDETTQQRVEIALLESHRKLQESEEQFRSLVENALAGIFVIDHNFRFIYGNDELARYLGYEREELVGTDFRKLITEKSLGIVVDNYNRRQRGEEDVPNRYEFSVLRKDGTELDVEISAAITKDVNGNPITIGQLLDITDRKKAIETLQTNEHFLETVFQGIRDGLVVLDREMTIVRTNHWIEKMRADRMPLVGEKCYNVFHELGKICPWCPSETTMETGEVETSVVQVTTADAADRWLEITSFPLIGDNGEVTSVVEHVKDITEKKNYQESLGRYAERLNIMRAIDQAILTAQSPQEIASGAIRHIQTLIPCQRGSVVNFDLELDISTMLATQTDLETEADINYQVPLKVLNIEPLKKGEIIHEANLANFTDAPPPLRLLQKEGIKTYAMIPMIAQDELIGALNLGKTIEEPFTNEQLEIAQEVANELAIAIRQARLHEAERRQRVLAQTLQKMYENMASLSDQYEIFSAVVKSLSELVEFDRAVVLLTEKEQARIAGTYGYPTPSTLLGTTYQYEENEVMRTVLSSGEMIALTRGENENWDPQLPCIEPEAKLWIGIPLTSGDAIIGMLCLTSDHQEKYPAYSYQTIRDFLQPAILSIEKNRILTELDSSLSTLREAQEHLTRSARLSVAGELAAGVAHQINNPLTTIIAQTYLLSKKLEHDSNAYAAAEAIKRAAYRAGTVVQRMLDLTRTRPYNMQMVDVGESVANAVDLIRSQIEPHIAKMTLKTDPNLPMIRASEPHLEDVWLNLILNARDIVIGQPDGIIEITTSFEPENNVIAVSVRDNGAGIPDEDIDQIFEPFFTTKEHGTGLGLAICQEIVRHHNGTLTVESTPGKGTTFTTRLPISEPTTTYAENR